MENQATQTDRGAGSLPVFSTFLLLSITAYFTWADSPLYFAGPSEMTYSVTAYNVLHDDKTPRSSHLEIAILNSSARPAKDVTLALHAITQTPEISCDEMCSTALQHDGRVLVNIERIPAITTATVKMRELTSYYPSVQHVFSGYRHQYVGKVLSVRTARGSIGESAPADTMIDPLPGDFDANPFSTDR